MIQADVNRGCTIHAELKRRCQRATLGPAMDERVRLLEDLANPVRYGALVRLERGAATASELAAVLGVSQTVLANHLRRLRERGLVVVRRRGRHAAYELAEPGLRELFSVVEELRGAPRAAVPSVPAGTCYDHLSGRLGVALYDALADAGAIVPDGGGVRLGEGAEAALARFGISVPAARRRLMAYPCLDRSEGRPHLGGALGASLAGALVERGWVVPEPGSRTARITPAGRRALAPLVGAERLG
jgi:DNA-binding transcriptional ArsR family regulator